MCGIHLVINANTYTSGLDKYMKDCFLANQVRGTDSSGAFQVLKSMNHANKSRNVDYYKDALCGSDFIDTKGGSDIIKNACNAVATVGHVRAATTGQITADNAHPFLTTRPDGSKIIGVHNGTLPSWRSKAGAEKFDVDSAWLFSKLANDGISSFEGFDGAFCLVWYDSTKPNSLFIARNDKRPLFWAFSQSGQVMYAASELGMLGWLLSRNNVTPKRIGDYSYQHPEAGHVYEINMLNPQEHNKTPFAKYDPALRLYDKPAVVSTPLVVTSTSSTVPFKQSTASKDVSKQEQFFESVKKVLRKARGASGVEEDEGLESVLDEKNFLYMHEPCTRNVSNSEERAAKTLGMFGLCVNFCGYFYDPDSGLLYGDFKTKENGKELKYDSIVRGESEAGAEIKYIHPDSLTRMVVVGVHTDPADPKNPFVVLEDIDKAKDKALHTVPVMDYEALKGTVASARTVH